MKAVPSTCTGIVFDLDGTLVDSALDFDQMRRDIGIPGRHPVLEWVESLPVGPERERAEAILLEHEFRGARVATLMPGVEALLRAIEALGLKRGILTRNLPEPTRLTMERLGLHGFSQVLTRVDAPAKPDPAGLLRICESWGCKPSEAVFVGDFRFDLEAGKRAGMKTILYVGGVLASGKGHPAFKDEADHVVEDFGALARELPAVLGRLLQ